MRPPLALVALLLSLLASGCSEGRVSGVSPSDDAELGDPPSESEDYDAFMANWAHVRAAAVRR